MGLMARDSGGGDFELAPAGTHRAICYAVVDMGMQESTYGTKHKIRMSWELSDETMQDGRPFSVSKQYTLSLNEKATLRHDLEAWRNRGFTPEELDGFDLFTVVGVPCLVTVTHKPSQDGSRTYANVTGVTGLPKGMEKPNMVNPPMRFSPDDPQHNDASILPEWLQEKLAAAPVRSEEADRQGLEEARWVVNRPPAEMYDDLDDDLPF